MVWFLRNKRFNVNFFFKFLITNWGARMPQNTFGWRWLPIEDLWTSPPLTQPTSNSLNSLPLAPFVLFTFNFNVPFRINLINSYSIYIIWLICLKKRCKYISFIFSYVWCIYKFIFLNMWILNSYKQHYFNRRFNIFLKFEQLC